MEVMYHSPSHTCKRGRCLLSEPEEAGAKKIFQGERTGAAEEGKKGLQGK